MRTVIAKLQAREGKEAEMRAALEKMVAAVSTNEPGVPKYELHTSDEDPTVFYFYEQYDSEDASAAHGASDHMKQLGEDLKGVAGARPEITRLTWIAGVKR
ncbi:MAG: putative quinol monooxygenase [Chloroflexi bacterium]|nr:putative quinol monooxygenase [Chloroflexota bacterium]MDA1148136.1 putative quinol monooxygenase [Chloroflexota bacterium]